MINDDFSQYFHKGKIDEGNSKESVKIYCIFLQIDTDHYK